MWSIPAPSASSITSWMAGWSPTGNNSFGTAFVAGRNRVPSPAAGKTALRTCMRATIAFHLRCPPTSTSSSTPARPSRSSRRSTTTRSPSTHIPSRAMSCRSRRCSPPSGSRSRDRVSSRPTTAARSRRHRVGRARPTRRRRAVRRRSPPRPPGRTRVRRARRPARRAGRRPRPAARPPATDRTVPAPPRRAVPRTPSASIASESTDSLPAHTDLRRCRSAGDPSSGSKGDVMHAVARGRQFLARHPSAYWCTVALCAALAAWTVHQRIAAIDAERAAWGTARPVLMATAPLGPGDPIDAGDLRLVDVPEALAPERALAELPEGTRLRQRVGVGEILVDEDVTAAPGPAGRAPAGSVVVGLAAPDGDGAEIGLAVRIVADGIVLAHDATIVDRIGTTVFVAVPARDGPAVAAAERTGAAAMIYVPT